MYNQNIRQSDPFPVAPQTNNPTEIWGFNASSSSHAASWRGRCCVSHPVREDPTRRLTVKEPQRAGTKNEWRKLARWTTEANIVVPNDEGILRGKNFKDNPNWYICPRLLLGCVRSHDAVVLLLAPFPTSHLFFRKTTTEK